MSSSPMNAAAQHDQLVLLDGAKRWPVPGIARVTVGLGANVDVQNTPAEGTAVTQLNEAKAEIDVQVTMWTDAQWTAYQSLLTLLRRGTKDGPAVFTSAHPEIRARRVKRLYFISEQPQPYSPRDGYRVTLKFSEKLKDKTSTQPISDTGEITIPGAGAPTPMAPPGNSSEAAMLKAAQQALFTPPAPADGGRATTAQGGYCSAWQRDAATKAGISPGLFGADALRTESLWRQAGMTMPWSADSAKGLRPGQLVFFGKDPSGHGHAGTVVGFNAKGEPLIAGNSIPVYKANGGRLDAGGRPIDKNVEARGIVPLSQLGTPTSIGLPGGGPRVRASTAPAVPPPANRPSAAVPGPR